MVIDIAAGEVEDRGPTLSDSQKFARSGGLKGGKARAEKLTPEQRREIARKAARKRWSEN